MSFLGLLDENEEGYVYHGNVVAGFWSPTSWSEIRMRSDLQQFFCGRSSGFCAVSVLLAISRYLSELLNHLH